MATTTIIFGLILVILGLAGYFGTGTQSFTALIPALFGVILALLGFLAQNPERRKMAMHIAAALGVLGFLGTLPGLLKLPALWSGGEVARPAAVISQSIMAILMAIFTGLCVKSFVDARRNRAAI